MPEQLTPRQRELLTAIQYNIKANGYPPTVRELQRQGFGSPGNVHQLLTHLEQKGYIFRKKRGGSRAIEVISEKEPQGDRSRVVPILGDVESGTFKISAKTIEDEIILDSKLAGKGDVFAIRVQNKNMLDAGVFENDIVVIERKKTAQHGKPMIVSHNGQLMMKRIFSEKDRYLLQSENPQYQPFYADVDDKSFSILGCVKAVIRTYSTPPQTPESL